MTSYVMCNKKKLGIRKSDIECLKKSVEDRKLEYFKSELLKILDKKEKEESGEEVSKAFIVQELYKSMTDPLYMAKGGKVGVVGEIRTWNGKKYKKMPNKKWVRIYDTHDKHTEISIARLKGKVRKAQSVEELFDIVINNTHRFSDENGKPLDIVLELKKEVDSQKNLIRLKSENKETFGFRYGKLTKDEYRAIAMQSKPAKADGTIDLANLPKSAEDYLSYMMKDWNERKVISPIFDNTRIRFDGDSYRHFFKGKKGDRSPEEIELRAKCLPYIRDILERTGKKGVLIQNDKNQLAFSVLGRANINGFDTAIKIIVTKKKGRKYFYLSVNNMNEIKKTALPDKKTGSGAFTPSAVSTNNIAQDYNDVNKKLTDEQRADFLKYAETLPLNGFLSDEKKNQVIDTVHDWIQNKDNKLFDKISDTSKTMFSDIFGNGMARYMFEKETGLKLPKSAKDSRVFMHKWLGENYDKSCRNGLDKIEGLSEKAKDAVLNYYAELPRGDKMQFYNDVARKYLNVDGGKVFLIDYFMNGKNKGWTLAKDKQLDVNGKSKKVDLCLRIDDDNYIYSPLLFDNKAIRNFIKYYFDNKETVQKSFASIVNELKKSYFDNIGA